MIITSSALINSPVEGADLQTLGYPALFWDNVVTVDNLISTTENADFPTTNLVNPSTALLWKGDADSPLTDEYLTVTFGALPVDYLAVAKHNFGTIGATVSVEVQVEDSPNGWVEVTTPQTLDDDAPVIFRFAATGDSPPAFTAVRLRIQPVSEAPVNTPQAAVLYVGKSLVFERGVQGTYTPLPFGRVFEVSSGRSENSNFLGRVITGERQESSASFLGLSPTWVRTYLDPFLDVSGDRPFFFAWSPLVFPDETGFAWLRNDPQPGFDLDGYVSIDFDMTGIVS